MSPPSSVSIPRIGDDNRAARLLRLRADDRLVGALRPGLNSEAARLSVPSRESVEIGESVHVEVSFGPLADEVVLDGAVAAIHPTTSGRAPVVEIAIEHHAAERVRYIREVLAGNREAQARSHRRVEVDLVGRWSVGGRRYPARVLDVSPGGAFVTSRELPRLGAAVSLEIRLPSTGSALALDGAASWLRTTEPRGFGIQFRIRDRELATELRALVRRHAADAMTLVARPRH